MIGKVRFTVAGVTKEVVMDDRGDWSADDPLLAKMLNAQHGRASWSPAHGKPGYKQLADVAAMLGGEVLERREWPDSPAGTIH